MAYIASHALTHFNVADTSLTLKDSQTEQEVEITVPATTIR